MRVNNDKVYKTRKTKQPFVTIFIIFIQLIVYAVSYEGLSNLVTSHDKQGVLTNYYNRDPQGIQRFEVVCVTRHGTYNSSIIILCELSLRS